MALLFRHGVHTAALPRTEAISARVSLLVWSFAAAVGLLSAAIALCLSATESASIIGLASGFSYMLLGLTGMLVERYRKHLVATLPP